jgi:DsbC/DsbD-like thiol-disulfide interchange protein
MTYAERTAGQGMRWALALALILPGAPVLAADAFSTDWAPAAKSEARLVAAGGALAGFEIRLAPGAITYWRDPGEAGVPPTFDFAGSDNVAKVEPLFPAPKRIREADGSEAFAYETGVIIPLIVEPRDPAKPVTLTLDAHYAVCEKLCLPARAKLVLTLPDAGSPFAQSVDAARGRA